MSEALKERVRKHLEAGVQHSVKGKRVFLKDVVLVRAEGRETPVAQEARRLRPNRNLSYWSGETEREREEQSLCIRPRRQQAHGHTKEGRRASGYEDRA